MDYRRILNIHLETDKTLFIGMQILNVMRSPVNIFLINIF